MPWRPSSALCEGESRQQRKLRKYCGSRQNSAMQNLTGWIYLNDFSKQDIIQMMLLVSSSSSFFMTISSILNTTCRGWKQWKAQ